MRNNGAGRVQNRERAWRAHRDLQAGIGAHRRGLVLATALSGSVALAATGLSLASPALAATKAQPATPHVSVRVATSAKYGRILVDQAGHALYFDTANHPPKKWACTGHCLSFWPPLVLPAGEKLPAHAASLKGIGVLHGPSGQQVTWNGKPLYSFASDKPGQVNGQGIAHVWYVAQMGTGAKATTKNAGGSTKSGGGSTGSGW